MSHYVTVEAEVDLADVLDDDDMLSDLGLHRAEDCPAVIPALRAATDVREVIASLHRQAHPSAGASPYACREEPCRSLPLELVVTPVSDPERSAEAYKARMRAT